MELVAGDYISKIWLCESAKGAWTITTIFRYTTNCWDVTLTWDIIPSPGASVTCNTPIYKISLPATFSEDQIWQQVEMIIQGYELLGISKRIAEISVQSSDPKVFIDRFWEIAQNNDKISCSFVYRDTPPIPPMV
jgi:hypothetical protein